MIIYFISFFVSFSFNKLLIILEFNSSFDLFYCEIKPFFGRQGPDDAIILFFFYYLTGFYLRKNCKKNRSVQKFWEVKKVKASKYLQKLLNGTIGVLLENCKMFFF